MKLENRVLLENNLKNLTILIDSKLGKGIAGDMNAEINIIRLRESSKEKRVIGHELIHMASSKVNKTKNKLSYGFLHIYIDEHIEIGRALNEGYTELLTSRIFDQEQKKCVYQPQMRIGRIIEATFDDPQEMENMYFNAEPNKLVEHLSKFMTRSTAIRLLLEADKNLNLSINLFDNLSDIKLELKLYNTLISRITDQKKQEKLKAIICERPLVRYYLKGTKMVLSRKSLTNNQTEIKDEQTSHIRVA